jgi:hypothetical protein
MVVYLALRDHCPKIFGTSETIFFSVSIVKIKRIKWCRTPLNLFGFAKIQIRQSKIVRHETDKQQSIPLQRSSIATQWVFDVDRNVGLMIGLPVALPKHPEFIAMQMDWVIPTIREKFA